MAAVVSAAVLVRPDQEVAGHEATFQREQQERVHTLTLESAEEALKEEEFEVAFELFTRLLVSTPGPEQQVREAAQYGLCVSRAGMICAASAADHYSPAKHTERTTSPPCECPDSPASCAPPSPYLAKFQRAMSVGQRTNTASGGSFSSPKVSAYEIDIDGPATLSNPFPVNNRRRTLFQKTQSHAKSIQASAAHTVERKRSQVTIVRHSTASTEMHLMASWRNATTSIRNRFLTTRTWAADTTTGAPGVILRHYLTCCETSIDGGNRYL
jgi:hypothetical protein